MYGIGGAFGGILAAILANKWGRKYVLLANNVVLIGVSIS